MKCLMTKSAYIAGSTRIPFAKSLANYFNINNVDLMIYVLQKLVDKMDLEKKIIGEVALGSLMNRSTNWNFARECVLATSLDQHTPAYTLQRACGTSLEAALQISLKIAHGQIEDGIAGGSDSNSDLPIMINQSLSHKLLKIKQSKNIFQKTKVLASLKLSDFKPEFPLVTEPRTHLSMGQHCEKMVQEWNITRQAQDEFALRSHQNANAAYHEKFYEDLISEFMGLKCDQTIRTDTSLEKLAMLKTAFDATGKGTLTAGNSSPLTDGAAAVYLTNEENAKKYTYPLLARWVDAQVSAVDFLHGEGLLMAPTIAISELLTRNNLSLQSFDFYEIHEAFAGQVLCTLKAWQSKAYCKNVLKRHEALGEIDQTKLNVKGSSLAVGHPFAATGARIIGTLSKLLHQKGSGRGLISICTAGGMGVAAILESV
jgi:acetyl-CoA C-acetyltransferase